jgi:hypothetical protein
MTKTWLIRWLQSPWQTRRRLLELERERLDWQQEREQLQREKLELGVELMAAARQLREIRAEVEQLLQQQA